MAGTVKKLRFSEGVEVTAPVDLSIASEGLNIVNFLAINNNSLTFETNANNWITYDDGAVSAPVNGTGGTPAALTAVQSNASPLNGQGSYLISKNATNGQGEGTSLDFDLPSGYQGAQVLELSFLLDTTSANYASGDMGVYLYDVTNSLLLTPENSLLPANFKGQYKTLVSITNGATFRLIYHVRTTNALAYTVKVDDIFFGVVSNFAQVNYVDAVEIPNLVTDGLGTLATGTKMFKRILGSFVEYYGVVVAGTATGATVYFELDNGYKIDYSKLSTGIGNGFAVGTFEILNVNANQPFYDSAAGVNGLFFLDGVDDEKVFTAISFDNYVFVKATGTSAFGSNVGISFRFSVPVTQLQTTSFVESTQVESASSSTGTWDADAANTDTIFGLQGEAITGALTANRTKVVEFAYDLFPTDHLQIMLKIDGAWVPASDSKFASVSHSTNSYGLQITSVSGRQVTITANQYAAPGASYDGAGVAWTGSSPQPTHWRLVKSRNPLGVGQKLATNVAPGLAPAKVFKAGEEGIVSLQEISTQPESVSDGTELKMYMKDSKIIFKYNDGGTTRYKYLDLTGTGDTWTHTTTAP